MINAKDYEVNKDVLKFVEEIARGMNLYPVYLNHQDLLNISCVVGMHILYNHFIKDKIDFTRGYILAYNKYVKEV